MKPTSPLEVVNAFTDAVAVKDYDTAMQYIAHDCDYQNMPMGMDPVVGPEGVRAVLEPLFEPTLRNEFVVIRQAVDGPVVIQERLDKHYLEDRQVNLPVTGVWEVHDGLITIWHDYFDAPTFMSQWPVATEA